MCKITVIVSFMCIGNSAKLGLRFETFQYLGVSLKILILSIGSLFAFILNEIYKFACERMVKVCLLNSVRKIQPNFMKLKFFNMIIRLLI